MQSSCECCFRLRPHIIVCCQIAHFSCLRPPHPSSFHDSTIGTIRGPHHMPCISAALRAPPFFFFVQSYA
jgi:hypothetical protein